MLPQTRLVCALGMQHPSVVLAYLGVGTASASVIADSACLCLQYSALQRRASMFESKHDDAKFYCRFSVS